MLHVQSMVRLPTQAFYNYISIIKEKISSKTIRMIKYKYFFLKFYSRDMRYALWDQWNPYFIEVYNTNVQNKIQKIGKVIESNA